MENDLCVLIGIGEPQHYMFSPLMGIPRTIASGQSPARHPRMTRANMRRSEKDSHCPRNDQVPALLRPRSYQWNPSPSPDVLIFKSYHTFWRDEAAKLLTDIRDGARGLPVVNVW